MFEKKYNTTENIHFSAKQISINFVHLNTTW